MNNYYKYLPISQADKDWGLFVENAGCTHIGATGIYPAKTHPEHHNFNWTIGRILNEYQLIYITRGKGIFESESCKRKEIEAGTIILLFPGERHRYKPDDKTGWDENWIGMNGPILDNLVKKRFFIPEKPCLYIGFSESVFTLYSLIIEKIKQESSGYQQLISSATLHIMGICHGIIKQKSLEPDGKEKIVDQARLLFRANVGKDFSPKQAANELLIGYSSFRVIFKNHTGLSPGKYFIQLKIERAKDLLNDSNLTLKEIAYNLNFDSYFYFSKIFKEKTGYSPSAFRRHILG